MIINTPGIDATSARMAALRERQAQEAYDRQLHAAADRIRDAQRQAKADQRWVETVEDAIDGAGLDADRLMDYRTTEGYAFLSALDDLVDANPAEAGFAAVVASRAREFSSGGPRVTESITRNLPGYDRTGTTAIVEGALLPYGARRWLIAQSFQPGTTAFFDALDKSTALAVRAAEARDRRVKARNGGRVTESAVRVIEGFTESESVAIRQAAWYADLADQRRVLAPVFGADVERALEAVNRLVRSGPIRVVDGNGGRVVAELGGRRVTELGHEW